MNNFDGYLLNSSSYVPVFRDEFGGSYLGVELENVSFSDENLSHEYFNGAKLNQCLFQDKAVEHTWFKEAHLDGCVFIRCKLNSSDLVFSVFENCQFVDCDFSNGEWLESKFDNCTFQKSRFYSTTLNLSIFKNCFFDSDSFLGLNEQSVQYNVFESCRFASDVEIYDSFLCRNFGLANISKDFSTPADSDYFSILSGAMAKGNLTAIYFVKLFKEILSALISAAGGAHQLRSKYLSMICSSYISQGMLSIAGIMVVEQTLTHSLSRLKPNQFDLFNELTGLLFSLRLESTTKIETLEGLLAQCIGKNKVKSGLLFLNETYDEKQIEIYMKNLCSFCEIPFNSIEYKVLSGSTEIPFTLLSELAVSATGILSFIAVTLRSLKILTGDAKQILINAREIKEEVEKIKSKKTSSENSSLASTDSKELQNTESLTVVRILSGQQKSGLGNDVTQLVVENGESLLKVDSSGILRVEIQ